MNTKGPLSVCKLGNKADQYAIYDDGPEGRGRTVAVTHDDPGGRNAEAFSAMPDLLAVCEEIEEHGTDDWPARMRTLRDALAKARGNS